MTDRRARPSRWVAWLLAFAVVAIGCSDPAGQEVRSDEARADPAPATVTGTVAALNQFAGELYGAARDSGQNLAISTYAVATGLAMAREGAAGDTLAALDAALHTERAPDLAEGMNTIAQQLEAAEGEQRSELRKGEVTVDLAASLWAQDGTGFESRFLDRLAAYFDTGMRTVDFRSNPEGARDTINEWGDRESSGRIPQLLARGSIRDRTRFVVPSLGSLRAPWKVRLTAESADVDFTLPDGRSVDTPMLRVRDDGDLTVASGSGWTAVGLPYLGDDLTMVLVLPDAGRFDEVESTLGADLLSTITTSLQTAALEVALPPFEFASETDLEGPLTALGLGDLFVTDRADFSGITGDEPLAISRAVHQTFVTVDDDGSDADAATVVPTVEAPVTGATRVEIDRAFLFFVVDQRNDLVLQIGRVVDPTS